MTTLSEYTKGIREESLAGIQIRDCENDVCDEPMNSYRTGQGFSKLKPIQHEGGGGPYGPHTEELPDNSELARAGGPSFVDFQFELFLYVFAKNGGISMLRSKIMPVLSKPGRENPIAFICAKSGRFQFVPETSTGPWVGLFWV